MDLTDPKLIAVLSSIDASLQKISVSLTVLEQTTSMRFRVEEIAARAGVSPQEVMRAAYDMRGQKFESADQFEAAMIEKAKSKSL